MRTTTFPTNQKRAVAERRAVAKAATNLPSPLLHPFLFPVYYRQRSHGRGKSKHFCTGTNAGICASTTKPVWSPESRGGTRGLCARVLQLCCQFINQLKPQTNKQQQQRIEVGCLVLHCFVLQRGGIVLSNTCVSLKGPTLQL